MKAPDSRSRTELQTDCPLSEEGQASKEGRLSCFRRSFNISLLVTFLEDARRVADPQGRRKVVHVFKTHGGASAVGLDLTVGEDDASNTDETAERGRRASAGRVGEDGGRDDRSLSGRSHGNSRDHGEAEHG